ncbi:MAG: M15 family metallopeptidase [Clostridia bacterium]|nr:M15 family metallopeptidase [Clostridia bacterium]
MSKKSKKTSKRRQKKKSGSLSGSSFVLFMITLIAVGGLLFVACRHNEENSETSKESTEESSSENASKNSFEDASSTTSNEEKVSSAEGSLGENSSDSENSSEKVSVDSSEEPSEESSDITVDVQGGGEAYSHISWFKAENGRRYDAYGEKHPEYTKEQIVTYVNIGLDGAYYTNTYPAKKEDGNFILVNKYSYIDKNFTPDNLVELDDSCKISGKSVKLVKEAADAFKELSAAAKALEYSIIGMSGYRTYSYQESLYNRYLKNDTQANVDTYSARPGYSEHHTGLALDVQTDTVSFSNFGQTKEYEWLMDNAHLYGFVIHYTEENKRITGYMPEEWHIRYLGVDAATYIYDNNLSVDEYLVMFGANGHGGSDIIDTSGENDVTGDTSVETEQSEPQAKG